MKRSALAYLVLVTLASGCFAYTNYALHYLCWEPSAINNALGGSPVGVVNIWHKSALTAYDNPAIPSFQDGINYSVSREQMFQGLGSGFEDYYYNAGILTAAYRGIGVMLPAPTPVLGKFGNYADYGEQEAMDGNGIQISAFHPYDNALVLGVSINPFEYYRSDKPGYEKWLDNIDVSAGVSYVHSISYLGPGTGEVVSQRLV